ncbi:MAG: glycine cleavage system protein GcvH [Candidatus Altiarchaeota archaeon]
MAEIEGYNLPDDLYYHKEHYWAKVDGNTCTVGATDFTQKLAGEISYVMMPFEGDEVKQGDKIGTMETKKWVGDIYAPISGKVSGVNQALYDDPSAINNSPYGDGWIVKIEMSNPDELKNLMKGDAAVEWQKAEIAKHSKG